MGVKIFALLVICISAEVVHGRVYTRCGLARALLNQGFNRQDLDNWVCLVESESSRNTRAINRHNTDGSVDYGLFQMNSRYWCGIGYRGGECNMDCNTFINDDISGDSKCAKLIYSSRRFQAWVGWVKKCKGRRLPNIRYECGF